MNCHEQNEKIGNQIDQLFTSILEEQRSFNAVKPSDPAKGDIIKEKQQEYEKFRGRGFFYNYVSSGKGHGPFSELIDGSVKYDLIGGIGVNLLGHSHPIYIKANLEAATCDTIMCGNLQYYPQAAKLGQTLIDAVKEKSKLRHFWYSGSGSFANDVALKILWQKKAPNYKLIAFEKAFAGRSVAMQDVTYNQAYRDGMPKSIEVEHVPHYDFNDPKNAIQKTIDALDAVWAKDPGGYCAIMMELIQGEGGFIYADKEYYEAVFKWAKAKGIYVWIDEVQSFARTEQLFSYQMFELDEYVDIVTVGKCLQSCGTLYTEELNPKPGLIAGTFLSSIAALNAGYSTLKLLLDGGFYGSNGRMATLQNSFRERFEKLKTTTCAGKLGYYGGVGTMVSFEIGDSSKELTTTFVKKLFDNGIISFFAGNNPTRVRFLCPITLTDEHLDDIFSIIEKTIQEVVK